MSEQDKWNWMWAADWTNDDQAVPRLVCFRSSFFLEGVPERLYLNLFADSRYKLYINGKFVNEGPQKGHGSVRFYDRLEVADFLQTGVNALAVEVLRYPPDPELGNHSLLRLPAPVLGIGCDQNMSVNDWKSRIDRKRHFLREEERFSPLCIHEEAEGDEAYAGWQLPDFDDSCWETVVVCTGKPEKELWNNYERKERELPLMERSAGSSFRMKKSIQTSHSEKEWQQFLDGNKNLTIPVLTRCVVEIDAGEEMTGFLNLQMEKGQGSCIQLLESEAYALSIQQVQGTDLIPVKGDRTDAENGFLTGYEDRYHVSGYGSERCPEVYAPFWFRTFRFIRLTIETDEEPLTLRELSYTETGYPLNAQTCVTTSDPTLTGIWEISLRTLRRCMHDTYMDCPFYEQLQYAMDARTQILYTYAVSADDRLARQCMEAFRASQRPDGMINCSCPNTSQNLIVSFPIYYVLMLYDHMMYFGDKEFLERHKEAAWKVLSFYENHLDSRGFLQKIGDVNLKGDYWSFIDWANEWNATTGMPPAGLKGPLTMESLLYVMGLQKAAKIAEYLDDEETAADFRTRADSVRGAIRAYCQDEDGMVTDGPGIREYSQHCQVFALLTDTISMETGRKNLLRTMQERDQYPQCTVAMRYYLFRALEMAGLYEWTDQYWDTWRDMIRNHASTCVEAEQYARSDCHAWGALALYELPCTVMGIRPASPGFGTVAIRPHCGYMTHAEGKVMTPKGMIEAAWSIQDGSMQMSYKLPPGLVQSDSDERI